MHKSLFNHFVSVLTFFFRTLATECQRLTCLLYEKLLICNYGVYIILKLSQLYLINPRANLSLLSYCID